MLLHAVRSLWRLGTPNVWIDEAASWWGVSGSWGRWLDHVMAADDCGGFLYSLLLKLWTAVAGDSEAAMRLPSVALTLLLAGVVFRLARRLWSRRAGLFAALMIGLYPVVFLQSRQARAYALWLLLYAVVLLGLALRLTGDARERRAGGLCVALAGSALVVTHIFGVVALAGAMAVAVLAAIVRREAHPGGLGRRLAAALAPYLPPLLVLAGWLALFWQRLESRRDAFWLDPTRAQIATVYLGLVEYLLPIALAVAVLLARPGRGSDPDRERARLQAVALAVLTLPVLAGPLVATLASRGGHHFVLERYFLPLAVLGALGLGYLLSRLPRKLAIAAAGLVLVASVLKPGTIAAYGEGAPHGTLSEQAAGFLRSEVGGTPGGGTDGMEAQVFVSPDFQVMAFRYYDAPNLRFPPGDDWRCRGFPDLLAAARAAGRKTAWVAHFECAPAGFLPPGAQVAGRHRFGPLKLVEVSLGDGSAPGSSGAPGSPPAARTTPDPPGY